MTPSQRRWSRLRWLILIWLASVLTLCAFAYGFRLMMTAAGLTV